MFPQIGAPATVRIDPESKNVFVEEDGSVWVGFNISRLPQRRNAYFGNLRDAMVPRFYNDRFPYLCAALIPCALTGYFLEHFRTFDVVRVDGRYSLSPWQIKSWDTYETFAFRLCKNLLSDMSMPLNFSLPVLPSKLGYSRLYESEMDVQSRARTARRAFCILFGMTTYLIALEPRWEQIARLSGIPDDWTLGLKHSPIANFNVREGRIGSFIDFSENAEEVRHLPTLIQKHIPFWIFWGDGETYKPPVHGQRELRIVEMLRPSKESVRFAKQLAVMQKQLDNVETPAFLNEGDYSAFWDYDFGLPIPPPTSDVPESQHGPASCPVLSGTHSSRPQSASDLQKTRVDANATTIRPAETNLPPVEPYSGIDAFRPGQVEKGSRQLPLETPDKFWNRQHAEDMEKLSKMPERERKRLRNERKGDFITKKSVVFHWEKFSWGYVRRRISRKELDDYLDYPPSQMRFSVTRNEWDICEDFDADAKPPSPYPDSDDSCDFPRIPANKPNHDTEAVAELPTTSIPDEEGGILESDHLTMCASGPTSDELVSEKRFQEALKGRYSIRSDVTVRELPDVALDKMIYYRYGLFLERMHSFISSDKVDKPDAGAERAWATARGILYDAESSIDSFSLREMLGITQFVTLTLENHQVPPAILDIHPDNFNIPLAEGMRRVACMLCVQRRLLDRAVYLLQPDDSDFIVGLEEPSLVVEVLRRGAAAVRKGNFEPLSIFDHLASRGSSYRMLKFVKEPGMELDAPSWDLGYRALDDEPGAFAYAQYERLLESFMRQPRARHALGLGGPIWRLIMEVLGPTRRMTGPSEDAYLFGRNFVLPDGRIFQEDKLTEADIRFLCGTYKVKKGEHVMLYSWWPSPRQWESATSNVRYWSPGNERWFMMRLHDIRNGRVSWVHAPKWSQKLKTNKKTKRLMERNETTCRTFLEHIQSS